MWRCADDSTPAASRSGLAELAVGGARDQASGLLHPFEQAGEGGRGQRQVVAQRRQRAGSSRLARDDVHQQAGDQRLGLLVPVRLGLLVVGVVDQRIGERHAVVGDIEPGRVDAVERVVAGRGQAG